MHEQLHDASTDLAREPVPVTDPHLSVAIIAAYVDGVLDADARAQADRHLAGCAVCRAELAQVADLVVDLPAARRGRSWRIGAASLAAAGIVGFLFLSPTPAPRSSRTVERTTRSAAATLQVIAPPQVEGGVAALRDGRIVWHAVDPQATYRVTVTDTTGATRWSAETSDTLVVIPPSARGEAGARYYLYVDALRADGWSVQSGPLAFTTAR
jgi:anti-sigma factor RsiW